MKRAIAFTQWAFQVPVLWLVAAVLLIGQSSFGQAVYGNITGSVTDRTGATVTGAEVSVQNLDRGTTQTAATGTSGQFTVANLLPGNYSLTVKKPGFKTFVQEKAEVLVGVSTTLDVHLDAGSISEVITVTSTTPVIETENAEVSVNMDAKMMEELPVLNRNFTTLQLLVPGVVKQPWQHSPVENAQGGIQVVSNGQAFDSSNVLLDGLDNNSPVLGIMTVNPPIDALAEAKFTTNSFDAQFAKAGGTLIQVETKSGSNQLHGSLFEYLQNNYFQARDPFNQPVSTLPKLPELRWNQFGGSLGGPIIKDKLFAFVDYQGARERLGGSGNARVPTAAERGGDLTVLAALAGVNIYDPTTGNSDGTGRTQFSDPSRGTPSNPSGLNIIPQNRISAPIAAYLALIPLPNFSNPAGAAGFNYVGSGVTTESINQFDVRVDQLVSPKINYFGRYSYGGYSINAPGLFGEGGGPIFSNTSNVGGGIGSILNQSGVGGLVYTFSSNLLADFRFGIERYRVNVGRPFGDQQLATTLGFGGINDPTRKDTWGLPQLEVSGAGASDITAGNIGAGYNCGCPLHEVENTYEAVTNWTKIHNQHTFKWGGDVLLRNNVRANQTPPNYNFDPITTAINTGTTISPQQVGGLGLASLLLGDPDFFQRNLYSRFDAGDKQWTMSFYGQDIWHMTSKLTVNYGLRWDTWFADRATIAGQGGRYNAPDDSFYVPGVGGVSMSAGVQTQYHNFSPRLGIAYAPDQKTVVRIGYGISYFQADSGTTFNTLAGNSNYPLAVEQVNSAVTNGASYLPLPYPLSTGPQAVTFPTVPSNGVIPITLSNISYSGANYEPPDIKMPYVESWNLVVERAIPGNASVSLGYVGNAGRDIHFLIPLNSAGAGGTGPLSLKFGLPLNQINEFCDCVNTSYNALQAKFTKRMSRNYSFLASYTWGKFLDYGEYFVPLPDYRRAWGPGFTDRKHVFTLAHTVILPFGRGQRWASNVGRVADAIIGGWEWTGITSIESGAPFSPNSTGDGNFNLPPNQIGNPYAGQCVNGFPTHTRNCWFNPAAFAAAPTGQFGNVRSNSLRGPGVFGADWSLGKNFHPTERINVQFRADAFNVLNHVNLGRPDGGSGQISSINSSFPARNLQLGMHATF